MDVPTAGLAEPATPKTSAPNELTYDQVEGVQGSPEVNLPEVRPSARSRFGPLRHRHFRNVWLGSCGSNIGRWMEALAIQWLIAEVSAQPTVAMGYLAVAQMGPTLALGLYGGLLADRMNRRTLLLVTQGVMAVLAAVLALLSWKGLATENTLLLIGLLQGVTGAFDMPAWQVLTPRLVPREELTEAIALNGLQFNLARIVGPALAGAMMTYMPGGATSVFVFNTFSFGYVIVAVLGTPDAPPPDQANESFWAQTREALRFVFRERGPRAAMLASVIFGLLATPAQRMLPVFVQDVLHLKEWAFGLLTAVMGAGAVVGVLVLRLVPRWYPKHHIIPLSIFGCALAVVGFAASDRLWMTACAIFVVGLFWLWTFNMSYAAVQLLVPDRMRGRVLAVVNVAVFGAMPLGAVIAGYLGEYVAGKADVGRGAQVGVGALGVVLAAAGAVMLTWRTPEVDGLKPGDPGYDRRPGFLRGLTGATHRPRD